MYSERNDKALQYTGTLLRRYELMDDVLQSVKEGNEFRALKAMNERNTLPVSYIMKTELLQWQYECIQIKALLEHTLRRTGVSELFLNSVNTEFLHRISNSKTIDECRNINLAMVRRYSSMSTLNEKKKYSLLVQRVVFLVDMDLSQTLTLQYFADILNVNRCYLSDLFKKETGTTITEYVTKRRIARAADLLIMSQNSVRQIAEQVGVPDIHYFSRLFKKNTGMTPSQYRERGVKRKEN